VGEGACDRMGMRISKRGAGGQEQIQEWMRTIRSSRSMCGSVRTEQTPVIYYYRFKILGSVLYQMS
jgi:hypothetical protein